MRTSVFALGLFAFGLAHCSSDRGNFVGAERDGTGGDAGADESGGTGTGMTGGNGGTSNGGTETGGTENLGGTQNRGGTGSGAEGGEPPDPTGGTGAADRGGTDAGGSAGDAMRGGTGGVGAEAGSGTAARGGMNAGGRAGASNAGAGGNSDVDCAALAREYRERLAAAQQCTPATTDVQCSLEMPDDLLCGCKTYVNPARDADIKRLNEIIENARNCARICPAVLCRDVKRGVCSTDAIVAPARGRCVAEL